MQTNEAGIAIIKSFEGLRLIAYQDQVGVWTIGYGHTGDVSEGQTITQEDADALFLQDLQAREDVVNELVTVPLSSGQFSALVSFVYNLGRAALETSALLRCVNVNNFEAAAAQFPRWDHEGPKVVPGLLRRREAEKQLFES